MNGVSICLPSILKYMVYTPVISIAPPLAFFMLIPCCCHFFPTLPFWRACSNVCGVINATDALVSNKKRCLCDVPKLRYAHDQSAEMVGLFKLVFIFATILLPNDFLSNDVEKAAALNSLEPPYVWENGSSASTILHLQNPSDVRLHLLLCRCCSCCWCSWRRSMR
jgi:hypothetical protein